MNDEILDLREVLYGEHVCLIKRGNRYFIIALVSCIKSTPVDSFDMPIMSVPSPQLPLLGGFLWSNVSCGSRRVSLRIHLQYLESYDREKFGAGSPHRRDGFGVDHLINSYCRSIQSLIEFEIESERLGPDRSDWIAMRELNIRHR